MNSFDALVLGLLGASILVGVLRGAVREILYIAGWVLAFFLSYLLAADLAALFADWIGERLARLALAWLAIFLGVLVICSMVAGLLTEVVSKFGLDGLNRTAGGAIGFARGALLVLLFVLIAGMTRVPQSAWWNGAATTPALERIAMHAKSFLPESIASRIRYSDASPRATPAKDG
jgi:membrane protein required for colicin V production